MGVSCLRQRSAICVSRDISILHTWPSMTGRMSMRTRSRTISEEVKGRVSRYEQHAKAHAPAAAQQFMSADTASSTMPDHTSTAFWGYPMTLDYVVDVAFATDFKTYKEYPVIVDTGSSNLAMAVSSCTNCGDGATDLDVTLDESECIEVTYGSGAWSGYETAELSVGFCGEGGTGSGKSMGFLNSRQTTLQNTTLQNPRKNEKIFCFRVRLWYAPEEKKTFFSLPKRTDRGTRRRKKKCFFFCRDTPISYALEQRTIFQSVRWYSVRCFATAL